MLTNEQWLVYLYGIYPEGGITSVILFGSLVFYFVGAFVTFEALDGDEEAFKKYVLWGKRVAALLVTTVVLGYFVPDKKIFFAMVATPTLVESVTSEDGKLNKLNDILDLALDKAKRKLEEE